MSKLAQTLSSGRLAVTAGCLPPRGADASSVRKLAAALPARLDAVVVAEGGLACAAILAGEKHHPALSVITRDRNRLALESEVLSAASLGVQSVLCLSGDHQSIGEHHPRPEVAGAYDIDSVQLIAGIKGMCEAGVDFAGGKLESAPKLFIGTAAHPYLRPMELNLMRVRKSIRAGAAFLMTQPVFDLAGFGEWMEAIRAAGIDKLAAIIASVLPLSSAEQATRLAARKTYGQLGQELIGRMEKAADPAREGIAIAAEVARKLKAITGVRGIHVFAGDHEDAVAAVIQDAGL